MEVKFQKYQGTGNDFILIDNRAENFNKEDINLIKKLCDRKFGIGADGLILLQDKEGYDYEMVYYNSDGKKSSLCGNGGRCLAFFAKQLGIIKKQAKFLAIDGDHEVLISDFSDKHSSLIKLKMSNVETYEITDNSVFLNTGSPHYVVLSNNVLNMDVLGEGKKIRYSEPFKKEGTNVNFVQKINEQIFVRTYERGVENETLSCGTGVTASAIAANLLNLISQQDKFCKIKTLGGDLTVYFEKSGNIFINIWLEGPATFIFQGMINV